jgi:hypothetical protein
MLKFNFITIVYIMLFQFPSIAQSNVNSNSKEVATNYGLIFEKEIEYRLEDSSYTDVIQLLNLRDKSQVIQFKILINKAPDDNTILILKNIQKGSDLSDPGWLLDYNIIKGPIAKNGASQDEIFVVLYNQNPNGGILPGNYNNLINVNYKITGLPGLRNDIKSSMKISHAEASTFQGVAINITPSRDEFKIYVKRK